MSFSEEESHYYGNFTVLSLSDFSFIRSSPIHFNMGATTLPEISGIVSKETEVLRRWGSRNECLLSSIELKR